MNAGAEKLETQAYDFKNRVPGAGSPHTITTMANVQEAQDVQVFDTGSTVPSEEKTGCFESSSSSHSSRYNNQF